MPSSRHAALGSRHWDPARTCGETGPPLSMAVSPAGVSSAVVGHK